MEKALEYLNQARECYEKWGSDVKVAFIQKELDALKGGANGEDWCTSCRGVAFDGFICGKAEEDCEKNIGKKKVERNLNLVIKGREVMQLREEEPTGLDMCECGVDGYDWTYFNCT
eukprot:scaffold11567_cov83-Skeletonema_dohrnii-CCMP3373.AAC.2